jgi:hypothetical protein
MIAYLFEFIKTYGTQLSAIGAAIVFGFGVYKFQVERQTELFWKEFEVYHKLVKELVEPPEQGAPIYVDRQAAIIYEMRNFERYYPFTLRMLEGLNQEWASASNLHPRLLKEIRLTIEHLKSSNQKSTRICQNDCLP